MFALGFSFFLVVNMVLARPQQPQLAQQSQQHQQGGQDSTPVPIVSQTEEVGPDGSYSFSFEAGNGISVQEKISQKKNEQYNPQDPESSTDVQVIEGSFQYTAPDGQVINLRYLADENGFQPQGEHLPTAPPALGQQPQDQSQQQQYQGQQQQYPGQSQQFQGQQQQK